jgi:hypothetical protein
MVVGVACTVEGMMAGINSAGHVESGNNRLDFKVRRDQSQDDKDLIEDSVRGFHLQKVVELDVL